MSEEWRAVLGYEGLYEVSDLGRVRGLPRRYGKPGVLAPQLSAPGRTQYMRVSLRRDGQPRTHRVHTLVLTAFVRPPLEGELCRHLNGDSQDNRLGNLAWGSPSENALDMVAHRAHNMARKTHCPQGHEYTPENVYEVKRSDGGAARMCRTCGRERSRKREASRGPRPPRRRSSHCKHGHLLDEANTRVMVSGSRACRTCIRAGKRETRQAARQNSVQSQNSSD